VTTVLRRLLLLLSLMVWQGGFVFYGAVVVPVGAEVVGSHRVQGFVTQRVTNYLNAAGAAALACWCWDVAAGNVVSGRRTRWAVWGGLVFSLGVLVWLHPRLDGLLDADELRVLDRHHYRRLHQWYLTISTVQWVGAVNLIALTIRAWRAEDAA